MNKHKIMKFLSYLVNNNIFIYSVFAVFSSLLAVSIWLFFPVSFFGVHYYSLGLYILLVLGIVIFISYKKDLSIPLVKNILKKEYHRIKFKYCKKNRKPVLARIYFKILRYLILLFKSSKDSFEILKEDIFAELSELASKIKIRKKKQPMVPIFIKVCLGILGYIILLFKYVTLLFKSSGDNFNLLGDSIFVKFDKLVDEVNKDGVEDKFMAIRQTIDKIRNKEKVDENYLKELEKELFEFNKIKQKKATVFSLTAITALIITTVTAGLISSFIFPEIFKTKATSYGFFQTDWSGGISALTALHPEDEAGWDYYISKDNVSTSTVGELSLSLTNTTIFSQTSNSDWQTHATSSTYYSGGSVGIARPNGLACSANVECNSGFCVDSVCCNTACTGSTCQRCDSYSNAGVGTCGYVSSSAQNPDSECATASPGLAGSCKGATCSGTGYSCGYLAAGEQGQAACKRCSGASYDPANVTDDTGDSEGSNVCNATSGDCYRCSSGSCTYQTAAQDLFSECAQGSTSSDGCASTNCSGTGYSCGAQTSGDGGCPVCGKCSDTDVACEYHVVNTYDSGCSLCNACSGGEIGTCSTSETTSWSAGSYGCTGSAKCLSGTCVTCGGFALISSNCWHVGANSSQSCTTICSSYGGSAGNIPDTGCAACIAAGNTGGVCSTDSGTFSPSKCTNGVNCRISGSAWSVNGGTGYADWVRLCVCNY